MKRLLRLVPALVACLLAARAEAGQFAANHLFATAPLDGNIHEIDQNGDLVRTFGLGELNFPVGLAFGPDGRLWVSDYSSHRIIIFDATGAKVDERVGYGLSQPCGLAFGPLGSLYINNALSEKVTWIAWHGALYTTIDHSAFWDAIQAIALGPAGTFFVTDRTNGQLHEMDPGGDLLRPSIAVGSGLSQAVGICLGPKGTMLVTSWNQNEVYHFNANGWCTGAIAGAVPLNGPEFIARGPDDNYYIGCDLGNGGRIMGPGGEDIGQIGGGFSPPAYVGVAFAPFRFKSLVTGTLTRSGEKPKTIKDTKAVLSIQPGLNVVMLALKDDPQDTSDLPSIYMTPHHVFGGFYTDHNAGTATRRFTGLQRLPPDYFDGYASLGLKVSGRTSANGMFIVESASGTLHISGENASFQGKVSTVKLLK
ncbi:MAG: NHL repeat-containing protein [Planctomycetes bacterium]|nr:NHL repeat-containing protein [Planctomycetota bacterium]